MAFVIDGAEWQFDGWSAAEIEIALGRLLDRVTIAQGRRERVWIGDDLQTRSVLWGLSVWELWGPECPVDLPPELRQELAAMLGRAPLYLDEEAWPEGIPEHTEISVSGSQPSDNPDVAWAHHSVRSGHAVACLGLRRAGVHPTVTAACIANVHWVIDESGHRAFFRAAMDVEHDCEATLERLATHAFPDLCFVDGIWRGLGDFAGGYSGVREPLRELLAVLDDHGHWAFTAPPPAIREEDEVPTRTGDPSAKLIQQRFNTYGIVVAPEALDVRRDKTCREARERVFGGRTLYCEWHAKLRGDRNRVHLHPPVSESEDKLVVAIFHEHLPLP
ncbi:hypothetical protein [Thiocapsa marina]|uniref:Uncharacterized protein n=1 Tax=Thiocapsa marina 5811 TaxID=768671 RepID=F9U9N3_9GAMM|nr:hypothetical protein [Thiocapsa marina]EGV18831.1 hypothetical protein ThimaDRAFT_1635 [Thiocapsa marina 5811]